MSPTNHVAHHFGVANNKIPEVFHIPLKYQSLPVAFRRYIFFFLSKKSHIACRNLSQYTTSKKMRSILALHIILTLLYTRDAHILF